MAQLLTSTYREAMAARVRRPALVVLAYPAGEAEKVTAEVVAWSATRSAGGQAGKAVLTLANPGGRYDPAGTSPQAAWLAPGTRVTLAQGLQTAAGEELLPIFTGEVETAEAGYRPGEEETLVVRLLDRAGRALRREITSPLYENLPVQDIVTALFTDYGGLMAEEIALTPVDFPITRVQFVEESLLDAGALLLQAALQRLYFDAQGVLRSMSLLPPATPQWHYPDGREIIAVQESWHLPPATKCVVTGRLQEPRREVGAEVLWEEVTVSGYDYGVTVEVPFSPAGAVYEDVHLEVVTAIAPYEQVTLYAVSATGITVKVVSPVGRTITFRCYGKQVYYSVPHVTVLLADDALLTRYGEIREEISNALIPDDMTALALANYRLNLAAWSRHRLTARLLANPGLEPGDVIALIHPRTGQPLTLLAQEVTHAGRVGVEEYTEVEALVTNIS